MKARLTITLPEDLLTTIDAQIDGTQIRNRSHAIEQLIRHSLGRSVTTAVILAGGSKHNSHNPLLKKISKRYLLTLIIDQLKQHGITQLILCLPAGDLDIERTFADGSAAGINLQYLYEKKPLGTAGALHHAARLNPPQSAWLIIHGDVLSDIDYTSAIEFHQSEGAAATIVVKPKLGHKDLGEVYLRGSQVVQFSKQGSESEISIINTGTYILEPEVLNAIPATTPCQLESSVFPQLAQKNQLRAFIHQGVWYDISTDAHYKEAV